MAARNSGKDQRRAVSVIIAFSASAKCRGANTQLFYPGREGEVGGWNKEDTENVAKAKAICNECPVSADCLEYAMDFEEMFGIWGGLTSRERNRLRKTWKKAAPPAGD